MGQRHQIFIKIANPVFGKNTRIYKESEKKRLNKIFGRKKHTIVALHHQWLYGRSAAAMLWNILNVSNPKTVGCENPFSNQLFFNEVDTFVETLMAMVQVNTCPLSPRGISFERMHFLNEEEPFMREDFTMGDNNDGVLIIDAIERKYCFMNINTYEGGSMQMDSTSISFAPSMTPLSAREYMQCYYSETKERLNNNETPSSNKKINIELEKLIKDSFNPSVLTLDEVKEISPKVFKKVLA